MKPCEIRACYDDPRAKKQVRSGKKSAEFSTPIEVDLGTDPIFLDSDVDGWRDGAEVARGSDPLNIDSRPAIPASIATGVLTNDASTGISPDKNYTHKISGGAAATINGVTFEALTATATPANFRWEVSNNVKNTIVNNNNNWIPAQGGVTGPGLLSLLGSFAYPGGQTPSNAFVFSNLTPGKTYEARLYLRAWDINDFRAIDFAFTNGTEEVIPFESILLDQPDVTLGCDRHAAYYVSYRYVAQESEMKIQAIVPPAEIQYSASAGSMHLYGASNELLAVAPVSELKVTSASRNAAGEFLIRFTGNPSQSYKVTKSSNLTGAFVPLAVPMSVTTDASGVGNVVIPASEASDPREFYRIEE